MVGSMKVTRNHELLDILTAYRELLCAKNEHHESQIAPVNTVLPAMIYNVAGTLGGAGAVGGSVGVVPPGTVYVAFSLCIPVSVNCTPFIVKGTMY